MNKKWLVLSVMMALASAACTEKNKEKNAESMVQPIETISKTKEQQEQSAVQMLLPNFSQLVEREGAAVVNIKGVGSQKRSEAFLELWREMFPDDPDPDEEDNNEDKTQFGSGVIISADGFILTNSHVVKSLQEIKITLNDKREYNAQLIGADEKTDIALLKIEAENLPVASLGNSGSLKVGEWVAAIGTPFGFENSVTAGIVSAKNRSLPYENYTPFIQTDVAINPGNSGGPLYNLSGEVVGINSQIYSRSGGFMGISFAIPIEIAMNVAQQLRTTGKVDRGQLGIIIQEVDYRLAQSFDLEKPEGALIAQILPGSPAEKAGLQVGDIIRSANGEVVRNSNNLPVIVGALMPGERVKLDIWRRGKDVALDVIIAQNDNDGEKNDEKKPRKINSISAFQVSKIGLIIDVQIADETQRLLVLSSKGISARAGIQKGDVVLQVNGHDVKDQESFVRALKETKKKNVRLLIERNGLPMFVAMDISEIS